MRTPRLTAAALTLAAATLSHQTLAQPATTLPSETPTNFHPQTPTADFTRREIMIPMRDGVKLHTVILIPKSATPAAHAPILLTRTPYDANMQTSYGAAAKLIAALDGYDNAADAIVQAGYIRVIQDVRGKYHSEGDYVMNRPPIGPQNPTKVDDSTDCYDTIDWLVKNTPESNGRVGTIGISYDGWTTLMSLINPHPALKVAIPMNPMVDGWIGDDWYHRGAFRQLGSINYIYEQEATRDNAEKWWTDHYDDYDTFLEAGPGDAVARQHNTAAMGFYAKIRQHTAYDQWWQDQAVDKILARQPLTVPTMLVHSLWDQEDIYGALSVYKALKPKDDAHNLFLTLGPWHHGQAIDDGSTLGDLHFNSDTSLTWRMHVLRPFLDHFLLDQPGPIPVAPVSAFETGTNHWIRLNTWPAGCSAGCTTSQKPLYLAPAGKLSFDQPADANPAYASYISDPAKPIPFVPRPIHLLADGEAAQWVNWLSTDQRPASTRTDVLTFETDRLTSPLKIAGVPVANLIAATTGTDGDFVVKLIDVYPDMVAQTPAMGGYQLMVSADILRGRYRASYTNPTAIPANEKQSYRFALPNVNHVFLPGHRIMVQVQSTWFPLYDRNPQTYVPNIFDAKSEDYRPAEIHVFDSGKDTSFVELPNVQ